jgi:hypothetical protein
MPSTDHQQRRRAWVAVAAVLATVLLASAFAAPAGAETSQAAEVTAAPTTATSTASAATAPAATSTSAASAPPAEASLPPAEESAPAEDVTAASAAETDAASVAPEPADVQEISNTNSAASAPAESSHPSSGSTSSPPPAPRPDRTSPRVPVEIDTAAAGAGMADDATPGVAERTSQLAGEVGRAPGTATALIAGGALPGNDGQARIEAVPSTLVTGFSAGPLADAATPVREVLNLVAPPVLEELLPSAIENVLTSAAASAGAVLPVFTSESPALAGRELAGSIGAPERDASLQGSLPLKSLSSFGVIELSRSAAGGDPAVSMSRSPSLPAAGGIRFGSDGGRFSHDSPFNHPSPPLDAPGAAPGSGGSFFVPLAALLALLALVAPATFRRLGAVPEFRPPIPFVCALERPG